MPPEEDQATMTSNRQRKFGEVSYVILDICVQIDKRTDKRKDMLITNSALSTGGRVNIWMLLKWSFTGLCNAQPTVSAD